MAGKFLDLKEAAKLLGVSPETLIEMRSRGEIFGYRDGASWKFKTEEVDRVLAERSTAAKPPSDILGDNEDSFGDFMLEAPKKIGEGSVGAEEPLAPSKLSGSSGLGSSEGSSDIGSDDQESDDSILVNEDEDDSSPSSPRHSTVIGKDSGKKPSDSDLKIAGQEPIQPAKGGSSKTQAAKEGSSKTNQVKDGSSKAGGSGKAGSKLGSSPNVLSDSLSGDSLASGLSSGLSSGLGGGNTGELDYEIISDADGELSAGLSAGMSSEMARNEPASLSSGSLSGASSESIDLIGQVRGSEMLSDVSLNESGISDIESGIQSDIQSEIPSDIQSGIESGIGLDESGIGSGVESGINDIDLDFTGKLGADHSDGSMSGGGEISVGADESGDEIPDSDDAISLDAEDEVQGGGSDHSDVTYRPSGSGINLVSPSDSGISLEEEPLDLGGSAVEPMELPEDEDEVISLEDEAADPDVATQLKADEAFSLSPVEGMGEDDSDSGSQVIALEDSAAAFGASVMSKPGASPLVAEGMESIESDPGMQAFDLAGSGAGMAGSAAEMSGMQRVPVELPYSMMNVLGLTFTAGTMAICGMIMYDIMLNMWSFNEPSGISTGVTNGLLSALGMNK